MSYCRWSSSNWSCDLYVYEDAHGGWTIHVAGNRVVGEVPKVEWPVDQSPEAVARFGEGHRAQMAFLETAEREPILLPFAGKTFNLPTAAACADKIEALVRLGYHVPAYVVLVLREEARETQENVR